MTHAPPADPFLDSDLARELRGKVDRGDLELPMLSQTATQVAALCLDGAADARTLASAVNHDPALAGHVLRVANSAAYAPAEPIVSLQQAISRLGLPTIGQIALAVSVGARVFHAPGHDGWVREMWRHAALTAAWAREIARAKRSSVEGAFVCGLLHDVGEPVMLQAAVDLLARSKTRATRAQLEPLVHELHAAAGARLARTWRMAPWIADAIEHHHDELALRGGQDAQIVVLADELALHMVADLEGYPARALEHLRGSRVVEELNLYEDELAALLARAESVHTFAGAME
jgi:putative nucleotidyltransferase with HDIG domain